MRKRLFMGIGTLLVFLGITAAGIQYYSFVTEMVYTESVSHLTEIYHQVNQSLHSLVTGNWSTMHLWVRYMEGLGDDEIESFVVRAKEVMGFTDFYFVSQEGTFITTEGQTGYLDLQGNLSDLIQQRQNILVNGVVSGQSQSTVFAVPAAKGRYHNFTYEAIAVCFNNSDLVDTMEINAFDGKAKTFVVRSDGRVLVDNQVGIQPITNFVNMLREVSSMGEAGVEKFQKNLLEGNFGADTFRLDGTEYYLVYEPAGFEDWMVLGVVPVSAVNHSMSKLQSVTMLGTAGTVLAFGIVLLLLTIERNREKLKEKDDAILVRDELFLHLSGNVDDVFLMLDADSMKVDYISQNVEKLLGVEEQRIYQNNRYIDCILKENVNLHVLDEICDIPVGQQREWDREYVHQKSGENLWFHVNVLCRQIQGAKKYIVVMSDRTKDRKINQELAVAVSAAQSASKAKSLFLSNMSHDIRTPMNAIIGFASLAISQLDKPDRLKSYLEQIMDSGKHLLSLIDDIMDMSRIESGKLKLEETTVDFSEIVRDMRSMISRQVEEKNQILHVEMIDIEDEKIVCDKTRLIQVLLNLLTNAVKFTKPGGEITLRIIQLSRAVHGRAEYEIRVKDNGIGMSPEFVSHIFELFERENTSVVKQIQGTGLGMPICKNLVEMMGGSIEVSTKQGVGTEFIIHLSFRLQSDRDKKTGCVPEYDRAAGYAPSFSEETDDETAPLHTKTSKEYFTNKKVLLAEDNDINQVIAEELLKTLGFQVETAENGAQAVDMVSEKGLTYYDLILMDIRMPVMDGYAAARQIRSMESTAAGQIPILAMTANVNEKDRREALESGMNGFISKPIDIDNMIQTMYSVLNEPSVHHETSIQN